MKYQNDYVLKLYYIKKDVVYKLSKIETNSVEAFSSVLVQPGLQHSYRQSHAGLVFTRSNPMIAIVNEPITKFV